MTLKKWLKPIQTAGLQCKIYMNYKCAGDFEANCEYSGSMYDIPYHLVDYQIGYCAGDPAVCGEEPIYWALLNEESKTYGFVINLKESEENE